MEPKSVFVSYSRKDDKWKEELMQQLAPLFQKEDLIALSDRDCSPEILPKLIARSQIAVMLVSSSFLASDFVTGLELPALLKAQSNNGLRLFWIPVSASSYMVTDLAGVPAASDPGKPLDTVPLGKRNQIWAGIAMKIAEAAGKAVPASLPDHKRVVLIYKRWAEPDESLVTHLQERFEARGCQAFVDRDMPPGIIWAKRLADELRAADAVIPLLSESSVGSEMLAYEIHLASEASQQQEGRPRILPIRVRYRAALPEALEILNPIQHAAWESEADSEPLVEKLVQWAQSPIEKPERVHMPAGGAVPHDDRLYIERETDAGLRGAIERGESMILIKGARQMGRTSLLARGLRQAEQAGAKIIYTDFQRLNLAELSTLDRMYRSLAESMEESLDLGVSVDDAWSPGKPPNGNLERFLKRQVLSRFEGRVVWGMDEVDRLFQFPYSTEFFGLLRSWHNARTTKPDGRLERLSIVIAYATEPYLFITDLNQSPFNVGVQLEVKDFTLDQVMELNGRYDAPLKSRADVERFFRVVGGQPFLVRRGFYELCQRGQTLDRFLERSSKEEGPYGDHLRRLLVVLASNGDMFAAVNRALRGDAKFTADQFYRLKRAGIFIGESPDNAHIRCPLYASYIESHLGATRPVLAVAREV